MKNHMIINLIATVILALLLLTGCSNNVDMQARDNYTDDLTVNDHSDMTLDAEFISPVFSTTEELLYAINSSKNLNEDKNDIPDIEYFFVPSASFSGFELMQIEVLSERIIYYYVPTDAADKSFSYDTGIVVTYARAEKAIDEKSLDVLSEQADIDLTEDGYLYEPERNSITFSVGNSWMSVRVPDNMNYYEQLKEYCVAEKVTVD